MTRAELLVFAQLLYETDGNTVKTAWKDLGDTTRAVWIDKVKKASQQRRHAVTDDEALRKLWRAAGGEFYGPNIETGSMPESKLLSFIRVLLYAG